MGLEWYIYVIFAVAALICCVVVIDVRTRRPPGDRAQRPGPSPARRDDQRGRPDPAGADNISAVRQTNHVSSCREMLG